MVGWRIALWAALLLVALAFLYLVRGILAPFVLAFVISALLDPTVRRLRSRGYSRPLAVVIVFVIFFGCLTALGLWITPVMGNQLTTFRDRIEQYSNQLAMQSREQNIFLRWTPQAQREEERPASRIDAFFEEYGGTLDRWGLPATKQAFIEQYIKPHEAQITTSAQKFFNSLIGLFATLGSQLLLMVFTPIFVLLILLDIERFKRRAAGIIPPSIRADTLELLSDIGQVFVKYMRGVTLVVIWYVLVAAIVLSILGAPYSVLLALLFSLIYLVPIVGPIANALLLFLITGLSGKSANLMFGFESPWVFAAVITVAYFLVMVIFDQLVYARVVGSSVGLHPIVSFFVIFSGGALFGAVGMLLAFPVAGSIKVILDRLLKVTSSREGLDLPAIPLRHRTSGG